MRDRRRKAQKGNFRVPFLVSDLLSRSTLVRPVSLPPLVVTLCVLLCAAVAQADDHAPGRKPSVVEQPEISDSLIIGTEALFDNDSAAIDAMNRQVLVGLFSRLSAYRGITAITVVGHTSSNGTAAYNQALSERRADAVARLLATRYPAARIHSLGRGETQPIADNSTPEGAARNRRIAVHLHGASRIETYAEALP